MQNIKFSHLIIPISLSLMPLSCSDSTQFGEVTSPASIDAEKADDSTTTNPEEGSSSLDNDAAKTPSVDEGKDGSNEGTSALPNSSGHASEGGSSSAGGPADPTSSPVPKCDPGEVGLTKVTLLSTGIEQQVKNQTLRYELSVVSCADGSIIPIKNQAIWFDLNAIATGGFLTSTYTVYDAVAQKSIATGSLKIVRGRDMFKNLGSNYAHWETESLSYSTEVEKLILEIDLKGNSFKPYESGAKTIASYLKVAGTQTVTQDLKITNR